MAQHGRFQTGPDAAGRRRGRGAVRSAASGLIAVTAAGALLLGIAAPANAVPASAMPASAMPVHALPPPPTNPSDQQIQQSQDQAQSTAAEVGRLSGLVTKTEGDIDALQSQMELKAELANKARVDLQIAQQQAAEAKTAAATAEQVAQASQQAVDTAQAKAADFAAASFRQGSMLGSMSALFGASSPTDLLEREDLLNQISGSELNVIANLESARNQKANLDSAARAALDAATAAQQRADQAKQQADQAQAAAAQALQAGQVQLAQLQNQLQQQQQAYVQALNSVASLKAQRDAYNQWLVAKKAEEARLAKLAEERRLAAIAAAKKKAAEEAAARAAEARRIAALKAAQKAAAEKAAAEQAARQRAAELARERQAQLNFQREQAALAAAAANKVGPPPSAQGVYYANCAAARAAGAAPIKRGAPGYRAALDPNNNGWACDAGTQYAPPAPAPNPPALSGNSGSLSIGQQVLAAAEQWIGTPYAWGGGNASGPTYGICVPGAAWNDCNINGFDCSGLALYAWAQVGVSLPHYSAYQYYSGQHVSPGNLQPGDLVFYANNTSDPSTIHHVAIYAGNNMVVQAPESGSYVQLVPMYWDGYIGATRPGT